MTEHNELFLRGAIISFESKSLTLLHSDDTLTIYTLSEDLKVRVQKARQSPDQMAPTASERVENLVTEQMAPMKSAEAQRAESDAKKTVTLTGVVKGAIRPGRPDRNGKPTVWLLGAMHEDGHDEAVMYLVSFYLQAAKLAEQHLRDGSQFTVQAYKQPAPEEGKRQRLNVFHLVNYPGKQT